MVILVFKTKLTRFTQLNLLYEIPIYLFMVKLARVAPNPCRATCELPKVPDLEPCLKVIENDCLDDVITQGSTWMRDFIISDSEPIALKGVIPGADGTGTIILNGAINCISPGDVLYVFDPCEENECTSLRGCYTVADIVVECLAQSTNTKIFVEEELVTECDKELSFGLQSLAPGCASFTQPPMLVKTKALCDAKVVGKIVNRTNNLSLGACKIQTYLGSNEVLFYPGGHAECYDRLTVPQAGIHKATIKQVTRENDNYDRVVLDGGVTASANGECFAGSIESGIIAEMQVRCICGGFRLFIEPTSKTIDVGTPLAPDLRYFRGTKDFYACLGGCEELDVCEATPLGFFTISMTTLDEYDIEHTVVLANGEINLKTTALNF